MTRAHEIAWAAGLFEGEGCMTTHTGKSEIHAVIVMADEDVVRRFAAIAGLGTVIEQSGSQHRAIHHRQLWRWQASGDNAETVIRLLLPLFGARRAQRGRELLAKREAWRAEVRHARACPGCGAEFCPCRPGPNARKQRYCTRRCQLRATDAAYRQRQREAIAA